MLLPRSTSNVMRAVALIAALVAVSRSVQAETPVGCAAASQAQIAELSDRWNAALVAGNAGALASLYAEDAVLLPMLSDGPRVGRMAIMSYYNEYVRRHPQGRINTRSIMIGCNTASDIGTYVYRLTGQRKGTRVAVGGRYSTLYAYRDGQWLIVHHHTSAMTGLPRTASLEGR